ncbi:Asp23/Gls24 family envelope stress response protein [Rhodococcus sp. NPDC059234]|uniref:Asp23/Gls24 family envelope stress response protein n=1 Tax=Rhodococcus sp. NPDC059234 TaxID=3346781 RepID=UPI00366F8BD9
MQFGAASSTELVSSQGRTIIADAVVAKIAGIATREISGVFDVGGGTARVVGALRDRIPGARVNHGQGVAVEVGAKQAAIDIGIVAEYGVALHELAAGIRRNVIAAVERMTGLEVTEVNITVYDVVLFDETAPAGESDVRPRVQ